MSRFLRVVLLNGVYYVDMSDVTTETDINPAWEWERFLFTSTGDSDSSVYIQSQSHSKYITMDASGILALTDVTDNNCKFIVPNDDSEGGIYSPTQNRYLTLEPPKTAVQNIETKNYNSNILYRTAKTVDNFGYSTGANDEGLHLFKTSDKIWQKYAPHAYDDSKDGEILETNVMIPAGIYFIQIVQIGTINQGGIRGLRGSGIIVFDETLTQLNDSNPNSDVPFSWTWLENDHDTDSHNSGKPTLELEWVTRSGGLLPTRDLYVNIRFKDDATATTQGESVTLIFTCKKIMSWETPGVWSDEILNP